VSWSCVSSLLSGKRLGKYVFPIDCQFMMMIASNIIRLGVDHEPEGIETSDQSPTLA
jgi:hypothetical protein